MELAVRIHTPCRFFNSLLLPVLGKQHPLHAGSAWRIVVTPPGLAMRQK
jgi:hypothetical protein